MCSLMLSLLFTMYVPSLSNIRLILVGGGGVFANHQEIQLLLIILYAVVVNNRKYIPDSSIVTSLPPHLPYNVVPRVIV